MSLFGASTVVHVVTREELLRDGVLIDVSSIAREAGFRKPVALTAEVWADCVEWDNSDTNRQCPQDEEGRIWDVVWMAKNAAQRARCSSVTTFEVHRIPRGGRALVPKPVQLKLVIGSGDDGAPVFTIMQPGQD
jgi:hypothetical protein